MMTSSSSSSSSYSSSSFLSSTLLSEYIRCLQVRRLLQTMTLTSLLLLVSHDVMTTLGHDNVLRQTDVIVDYKHSADEQDTDIDDTRITSGECVVDGGSCTRSRHCCPGFTCSSASETSNGICVRDAALLEPPCHTSAECHEGMKCAVDHVTGQGYCHHTTSEETRQSREWSQHMYSERTGRLGAACETDADCKPFTLDGKDKLCCQDVHRGRQGTKRMCDRVTRISTCITSSPTVGERTKR